MSLILGSSQFIPTYGQPSLPDVWQCDAWYTNNPVQGNTTTAVKGKDCEEAFLFLPRGPDLLEWAIAGDSSLHSNHKNNTNSLPYKSTWGTCTIELFASGPSASKTAHTLLSGDTIRQMAGFILQSCIQPHNTGGFITNSLNNALNTLKTSNFTKEGTFPTSSTYTSLSIHFTSPNALTSPSPLARWNPGDMEPSVSQSLTRQLRSRVPTMVDTPELQKRLRRKAAYYSKIEKTMGRDKNGGSWWAPRRADSPVNTDELDGFACMGKGTESVGGAGLLCLAKGGSSSGTE